MLHVDDAAFVRAPRPLVYRRLTDLAAWPHWWPGCRIRPLSAGHEQQRWALQLRAGPARRLRCEVRPHGWRHDVGLRLVLRGPISGDVELWLEEVAGGTVVHHLAAVDSPLARPGAVTDAYRRAVRRGLWGLKDALQLEARTSAGLVP